MNMWPSRACVVEFHPTADVLLMTSWTTVCSWYPEKSSPPPTWGRSSIASRSVSLHQLVIVKSDPQHPLRGADPTSTQTWSNIFQLCFLGFTTVSKLVQFYPVNIVFATPAHCGHNGLLLILSNTWWTLWNNETAPPPPLILFIRIFFYSFGSIVAFFFLS